MGKVRDRLENGELVHIHQQCNARRQNESTSLIRVGRQGELGYIEEWIVNGVFY